MKRATSLCGGNLQKSAGGKKQMSLVTVRVFVLATLSTISRTAATEIETGDQESRTGAAIVAARRRGYKRALLLAVRPWWKDERKKDKKYSTQS